MKKDFNKKFGFTLSEVLITLGIVGIVAALTIPAIMKNYKNRLYVSELKKVYSQLTNATSSIMSDEHAQNFYETTGGVKDSCTSTDSEDCKGSAYFLTNYFKSMKQNCINGDGQCVAATYHSTKGKSANEFNSSYCIQTVNGAAICMFFDTKSNTSKIIVDVNGTSEPNITGRDVYVMQVASDGSITDISSDEDDCNAPDDNSPIIDLAKGCLTKVMNAGWKIEDDE